jgi:hypothetical protein
MKCLHQKEQLPESINVGLGSEVALDWTKKTKWKLVV